MDEWGQNSNARRDTLTRLRLRYEREQNTRQRRDDLIGYVSKGVIVACLIVVLELLTGAW